jgi:hypothetical protein
VTTAFKKSLAPLGPMLLMDLMGWFQGDHLLALLALAMTGIYLIVAARQPNLPKNSPATPKIK